MTRCSAFYAKCEAEGYTWCQKSPKAIRQIDNYLKFVRELEEKGVPRERTFVLLPEFRIRQLANIKDLKWREKIVSDTAEFLKNFPEGKIITDAQIRNLSSGHPIRTRSQRPPSIETQIKRLQKKIENYQSNIVWCQQQIKHLEEVKG